MNYVREALDVPPFALIASALALFTVGLLESGPVLGGVLATSAAIVREIALYRLDGHARMAVGN